MHDDHGSHDYPVFDVGDGPDPTVRVSRGDRFWFGEGDDTVEVRPLMVVIRGLKFDQEGVADGAAMDWVEGEGEIAR